jgi:hypothetical protein
MAISGPQHVRSLKKVERAGENNRGFLRRYVSAKDTHRAQKRGSSNHFSRPPILSQVDMWPLCPTTTVPHSISLLYLSHLPLPYRFLSLTLSSIHHSTCCISPLISRHLCHIVPHHLHPLTPHLPLCRPHNFSQPSCFLCMAIAQPSSLPIMPSPARPSSTSAA